MKLRSYVAYSASCENGTYFSVNHNNKIISIILKRKKIDIVVCESLLQATFDHNIQFLIHLAGYASAQKYAANKNTGCWSDIGTLPGTAGFSVCCIDLSAKSLAIETYAFIIFFK